MNKLITAISLATIFGASSVAGTAMAATLNVTYPSQQAYACLSIQGDSHTDMKCENGQPGLQETKTVQLHANTLGSDSVDFFATNSTQDAKIGITENGSGQFFTINNNSNGQITFSYNGTKYTGSTNSPVPYQDGTTIFVLSTATDSSSKSHSATEK